MRQKSILRQMMFWTALVFFVCGMTGPAEALHYDLDDGLILDADVTLSYAAALRTSKQDEDKLSPANINGDEGNRNFDQWDLINNRFSAIADIDLNYSVDFNSFGIFLRPRAFYDLAYQGSNANESPYTNNSLIAGKTSATDDFDDATIDAHGEKAEFLDYFAYAGFDLFDRYFQLRVGSQVIRWGESLYLQGGVSSAQAHLDATASSTPGTEVKEIYLPSGAVSAQYDVSDTFSLAAYYQYEWKKSRLNEAGSYFSTSDVVDEAGRLLIISSNMMLARGVDEPADDQGQFGLKLGYRAEWLNSTEFGFYYINYHQKFPTVNMDFVNSEYFMTYAEDIQLYGFSFGTEIQDASVGGEITVRRDFPVDTVNGAELEDVLQSQLSWIWSTPGPWGMDQIFFNGEVGFNQIIGLDSEEMSGDEDNFAWGYSLTLEPRIYQIMSNLDLSIPISYKGHPNGVSLVPGTFTEDTDSASIGFLFTYANNLTFNIKYIEYFNPDENPSSDRDHLAFDIKYTF